ncbi:mitochondrial dynamin GTPase Msp1 [Hypoxylon texense]
MESLRQQLHETQGALTEKSVHFRKLKAEHAEALGNWRSERQNFETRIKRLEEENSRLRMLKKDPNSGRRNSIATTLLGGADGDSTTPGGDAEPIVFTRAQMRDAERKYQHVKDELAAKTKLSEDLQRQLQFRGGTGLGVAALPDLTDDHIVAGWKKLRGQIRDLSTKRFHVPVAVLESEDKDYSQLSTHWKAYLSKSNLSGYLVQAVVWRCLNGSLFQKYCRVWGREQGNAATKLGGILSSKVQEAQFEDWRMLTGKLFDQAFAIDAVVLSELETRMYDILMRLAADTEPSEAIREALKNIVMTAAELSAIFARSRFVPLMADKPGSTLTRGFAVVEALMEVRGDYVTGTAVDMMVSPCLLKKEDDYSVLVKAEVVC